MRASSPPWTWTPIGMAPYWPIQAVVVVMAVPPPIMTTAWTCGTVFPFPGLDPLGIEVSMVSTRVWLFGILKLYHFHSRCFSSPPHHVLFSTFSIYVLYYGFVYTHTHTRPLTLNALKCLSNNNHNVAQSWIYILVSSMALCFFSPKLNIK